MTLGTDDLSSLDEAREALLAMASALSSPNTEGRQIVVATPTGDIERSTIQDADEALLVVDPKGTIIGVNGSAAELFGRLDLIGKDLSAVLVYPSGDPVSPEAITEGVVGVDRDGSTFTLELRTTPLELPGGRAYGLFVRDLMARHRAESPVVRAQARYRALVEQLPAVTFMAALDEGTSEMYVSPQIESLLGFSQEEWLSNPILWFSQLHPDDRTTWNLEFARGVASGGPFRADCRVYARDGQVRWIHGEARLIRDDLGNPLFLQGMAYDISEQKHAEAQLREAQDIKVRSERLAAIGQIAASISHDLRNPLGAIRNAWFYMRRRIADSNAFGGDPRIGTFSALIDRELSRCAAIIGDLLDYSRDRPLHRVALDLAAAADHALASVAKPAAGVTLINEVPRDLPPIYVDVDQIQRVLVNIAQNAAEAVDTVSGVVRLRARAEPDAVILEIADNGKGIPPEIRDKIFEPLFTTKLKGTGLGLSIVHKIVQRHGGTIKVESSSAGTTFRLELPFGAATAGPTPQMGGAADLR